MLGQHFFQEIGAKITEAMATSPAKDIEKNIRAILSSALSKLNCVTREEFDLQQEALVNTREQIDQLRSQLNKLESALKRQSTRSTSKTKKDPH